MIAVSLFSGCGGMDFGIEAAGFRVVFRNDIDKFACQTLRLNGAECVLQCPVEELSRARILSCAGHAVADQVDLLFGGPPCQPFSKSGYWARGDTLRLNDPRSNTLAQFLRLVEELKPRAFLLENVHGISYSGKEEGFSYMLDRIKTINRSLGTSYTPSWRVLNTANYGAPQTRTRFFMVGLRDGRRFHFPLPTHGQITGQSSPLFQTRLRPHLTAWDAIGHLSPDADEKLEVTGRWGTLLPSIPEGENYLWHTDRKQGLPLFGWRTRYWSFLLKLAKNRPSWTLQAQPGPAIGPFHWKNRKLSWCEMAALQTFPDSFRIRASRNEVQRQIGNAVPSLMAEILGREIAVQLGEPRSVESLRLAIHPADEIPPPEGCLPVPEEYHRLMGKHAPHPGTGRGRSYQGKTEQGDWQEPRCVLF